MSDDEDNQNLLNEIQALEDVLSQKQSFPSTSNVSQAKVPKLEAKFEREPNEDENFMNKNDAYDGYNCKDLQDLFEMNKKLIESLQMARDKMFSLLDDCTKNQDLIKEQIGNMSSKHNKIINLNAGMPYFKDKNYYTAKRNEDTENKIKNGELRLTELQRIHRWNQMDKNNLLKAIRHEVTLTVLKKDETEIDIDDTIRKTSQLPNDVKKAIGSLGSIKFDWLKIANNIPENNHTAEECEVMWNVFLHPKINKQKWTPKEDKNLNRVVEEHEFEDWDSIAKELGTNRSGYQCFIRYNTNNWKNLMKGQSWSPTDDQTLDHLVTRLKVGDYIPWGYIASCMNNWTKQQVYFRWTYSLAPHLKKGRFSKEEDNQLLDAVAKYGLNFSKISALVMMNRTNIQLKEHYQTLAARSTQSKKIWTLEEDEKLIELQKKYGSNWAKIVTELHNVTRIQARQRHASLIRYQTRGITLQHINRNQNVENPLLTHTTVTYTTNTPWSCENKEIFVKHLKVDEQLVNFFKRDNILRKSEEKKRKAYEPDKLKDDTKNLYNYLLKFNANLNITEYVDCDDIESSEMNQQLQVSLQDYMNKKRMGFSEDVEQVRLQMFGPQEPVPDKQRFIPALPFGFRVPKNKTKNLNTINYHLNTNEMNKIVLIMVLEPNKYVTEYLGEDIDNQFEKLKQIMADKTKISEKVYSLKCKPFASSDLFYDVAEVDNEDHVYRRPAALKKKLKYNWELNKMVTDDEPKEKVIMEGPSLPIIEPNRATLQAYQELLLNSASFSSDPMDFQDSNYRLTPKGREALYLFKRRYQQLFDIPTGLSRIIPPDIVDESAFLPMVEKLKKKSLKNKRLRKVIKVVNTKYLKE